MKTLTKLTSLMMVSAGLIASPIISAHPAPQGQPQNKVAPKKMVKKQANRGQAEKRAPRHH